MPKEDIFSKISLKDYNSILENVLEQKAFSEDVKNLLLSMLYKIENGYQDYKAVKVNVSQKNYFLEKIIETIKEECNEIELIKPLSEESKILEENKVNYIVDKTQGKITCYPNERIMIEALVTLSQKKIILNKKYNLYQKGIEEILYQGSCMNISEVIRDFNGWSWDITTSQMQSKNINLIYQNLTILLGNNFLQHWVTGEDKEETEEAQIPNNEILRSKYNSSFGMTNEELQDNREIDYIKLMQERLNKKYGKDSTEKFLDQLKKVLLSIGYNRDESQRQIILNEKNEIQEKLNKMQDNKMFIEGLTEIKKDLTKQIKNIDKLLSSEKLLKIEYEQRNSKLQNEEKIFSVSHLRIILQKERQSNLDKIKELNKQMEPNEFIRIKKEMKEKQNFFQDIDWQDFKKVNEEKQINKLQLCFLECFMEKIKKAQDKAQIKDLIYELRYYEQLPYQNTIISNLKNIKELQEKIDKTEEMLIKKACIEKVLVIFTQEQSLNKRILSNQFKSKIINLENTNYVLKYHKGILKIEIYDSNIVEETKEIQIVEKVELEVKLNKKIKLWE